MNAVIKPEKTAYERLPRRYRRFVDEYVVGGKTGSDALRAAGIGRKSRHVGKIASRLLQRDDIDAAIHERTKQFVADMGVRHERIIREMYAIATSDPRKLVDPETGLHVPLHQLDDATAAAIAAVDVEEVSTGGRTGMRYKYKLWDKTKATDKLGQYLKLWDAKATTVNVDARSVTNVIAGGPEALSGAVRLLEQARAIAAPVAAETGDTHGSVLPAAVRDESPGRGASVDAGEDT